MLHWLREKWSKRFVAYEGGNGESPDAAIVIRGVQSDLAGTYAEFFWLTNAYGQKDEDWHLISHSHGRHGEREIDCVEVQLKKGGRRAVFFDITESFGKY